MPLSAVSRRLLPIAAIALLGAGLTACSPSGLALTTQRTQGYSIPQGAMQQIRPGQHRDTVTIVLGSPQVTNSFGDQTAYYYIETKVSETAFGMDMIQERTVLAVYFDNNERVLDTAVYGLKDGKVFTIESRRTPSFGEDRTFIESIMKSF